MRVLSMEIMTVNKLITILCALFSLSLFSCQKDENNFGQYKNQITKKESDSLESDSAKAGLVDIIVPETTVPQTAQNYSQDLYDLWDLFFSTFVQVVSKNPLDTRVRFKEMNKLRQLRDKDFFNLVSLIEIKMAQADLTQMEDEQKKAFFINAYNYASLRLVNKGFLKKGEIIDSIKDLSKNFYSHEIFARDTVPFSNGIKSLDAILKEELKPLFIKEDRDESDPRFYLALNGATMSRGLLLNKAFRADTLDEQLEEVVTNALALARFAKIEDEKLKASKAIKWVRKDLEHKYGNLERFFSTYGISESTYKKISYQDFNWDLNSVAFYPGEVKDDPQDLPVVIAEEEEPFFEAKPCDYLKSESVEVIGHCNQVVDGRMNSTFIKYPGLVTSASLCLYKRKLSSGESSLGAIGDLSESKNGRNNESVSVAVEGKLETKKYGPRMRITEGIITTLEYTKASRRLMIRQNKLLPGQFLRKALLQCE